VGLPAGPLEITFERKRRAELPEKGGEMGKHFSFINENNLKNLIYLLKEETVQTIAIVISYLPPEFSSQVISSLDPETQARVAVELATVKLKSPEQVAEVEKRIKEKIDYIIGGEDYFLNLLDQVDPKTQENILYKLEQQNPELAAKLRRVVFTFQDIVILEKPALQRVIREAQREGVVLAIALKNASEEIKSAVMDVLSEGARAMLTEQMDLIGEIGEKRIEEEQKKIVRIVRALEKSGDIVVDHDKILSRISQTKVIEAVPEKEFTETTANNENENQSKFGYGFGSEAQTPYKEENTDTVKFSSSDTNYGYTDEGTFKIK
jgi:flagellar motor switch protein FliG